MPRKLIVWHAGARGNDVGSIGTRLAVYPVGVADGATVPGGAVAAGVFGCHTGGVVGAGGAVEFIPVITLVTGLYVGVTGSRGAGFGGTVGADILDSHTGGADISDSAIARICMSLKPAITALHRAPTSALPLGLPSFSAYRRYRCIGLPHRWC